MTELDRETLHQMLANQLVLLQQSKMSRGERSFYDDSTIEMFRRRTLAIMEKQDKEEQS